MNQCVDLVYCNAKNLPWLKITWYCDFSEWNEIIVSKTIKTKIIAPLAIFPIHDCYF